MKKFFKLLLKWIARAMIFFVALLTFIFLFFAVFQNKLVEKAINVINEKQNGLVSLESINLNPFLHFPDVSLKLNSLDYKLPVVKDDSLSYEPLLNLEELYVALDVVQLIKGDYRVSRINLGDGEINYTIEEDSVSNIEKALGISFGNDTVAETEPADTSFISFDLELLQVRNLTFHINDIPGNTRASFTVNGMQSAFSYYPDTIIASMMMHLSIPEISFNDITLDKPRDLSFSTSMTYDQQMETLEIRETMLDIQDALFQIDGRADLLKKDIDLRFSARNSGIDLLNFLFSGILKLKEIEHIGNGGIILKGDMSGSFKEGSLPLINAEFSASNMEFMVHSIGQTFSGINFNGTATNGSLSDFSDAQFELKNFHADFPDGKLDMKMRISNLLKPLVYLEIDGNADLSNLNQIIEIESLSNLEGNALISGIFDGRIDQGSQELFTNDGDLDIDLSDVNLNFENHRIRNLNGGFKIEGRNIGLEQLSFNVDGSDMAIESKLENILPFLLGYDADPSMQLQASSKNLDINKILNDTLIEGPLKDLSFSLDVQSKDEELKKFLEDGTLPEFNLGIADLGLIYPGINPIKSVNMQVATHENQLQISNLSGMIGESDFNFALAVNDYVAFIESDSSKVVELDFLINSGVLKARDIFTVNDEFTTLPEEFVSEEIHDLFLKGKVETTVGSLLSDNQLPDFKLQIKDLSWKLKQYPHDFEYFSADIENRDTVLFINNFSGYIGESNIELIARVANLLDSSGAISGDLEIKSDLLDVDALMDYELISSTENADTTEIDSMAISDAGLHDLDLPDLKFVLDIGELRYDGNELFKIGGQMRLKPYQIIYLDQLRLQTKTGGSVLLDGQFNVKDSSMYNFTASLSIDTLNMSDFNVQLVMEDSVYSLADNFNGVMSADGLAEFFINPDLSINLDTSTAIFNVKLEDGRVKNFAPLHAIGKYTGNSDLDNVQFGELRNSFTLSDGIVYVPLMSISSTLGLILLEGEQGLNGEMLYLARVPTRLIRGAAWNVLSNQQRKEPGEDEEIQRMETQKFAIITIYSKGDILDVKIGDKRDKYR